MRVKGLDKAKDDWNQLRNHRMEHYGFSVSNEFYQPSPYFWNREGCDLPLMGHYRGGSIFFICNGPSLVNGKNDLSLLKRPGVMTYGINNGPRTIRPNFWTCVDDPQRFIKSIWLDPCIQKIVPHAFAEKPIFDNEKWEKSNMLVGQCPNMLYFHRNEKFMADRWLYEDTLNWGNSGPNGGGRSVMLASLKIMFLLGFRNVFLMGADFKMSESNTYHFDEQRHKGAVNGNNNTYEQLKNEYFPALKPYFDAEGFNVYNCNPESELKVFDFVDFNDAIQFATKNLGDVDNERTWGLYSKPKEREKWKNEPSEQQKAHLETIKNRPEAPVYIDRQEIKVEIKPIVKAPVIQHPKPVNVAADPIVKNTDSKENKIIRNLPCGNLSMGSSEGRTPLVTDISPTQPTQPFQPSKPMPPKPPQMFNITIRDDGK